MSMAPDASERLASGRRASHFDSVNVTGKSGETVSMDWRLQARTR